MTSTSQDLIAYIRAFAGAWRDDPREDAELLSQFVNTREERAFSTLIWRHGPLVWRSCSRVLGNSSDAEDAFQSVFLAMSRKASKLRADTLSSWLYRVSRNAALTINARTKRRHEAELQINTSKYQVVDDTNKQELSTGLDEELDRLPEKLRVPLLLHYLEGKSQIEVAKILGCSRSTLQERLAKGEAILREKLEGRGLTLGAITISALLRKIAGIQAVPGRLIECTTRAAAAFRAGTLTGGSAEVAQKLLRVLAMEGVKRAGWWLMLGSVCTVLLGGAGLITWRMVARRTGKAESPAVRVVMSESAVDPHDYAKLDLYGDALPENALARIGTVRFRCPGSESQGKLFEGWNEKLDYKWQYTDALSSDGKTLISSHDGGTWGAGDHRITIRFWDTATGHQLREILMKGENSIIRLSLSPDNRLLAVAIGQEVWLLDASTGQTIGEVLPGVAPIAFSPDGKTLACGDFWKKGITFFDDGS